MRKLAIVGSAVLLVISVLGLAGSVVLNLVGHHDYDKYGEVPVPGVQTLALPAGDVTVTFHREKWGRSAGTAHGVPDGLDFSIQPPEGAAAPDVTPSRGPTNGSPHDEYTRVWVLQVHQAGDYAITTTGDAELFQSPRLAFGHDTTGSAILPWVFVGLGVAALIALLASILMRRRPAG